MASIAEQLRELGEARRRGDITDAEFEVFKADLLRHASSGPGGSRAAVSAPARAPEQVGAYRLLGELGRGGMGVVYRARHQLDSQAARQGGEVALKLMHGAFAQDATYRARFEREADVGLRLDHAGIVRVHDLVVDAGQLALVMELVDGRPLTAVLSERPPWSQGLDKLHGVLDAMRYSHEMKVLHRDLKPANIMVSRAGAWKVADFGLARAQDVSAGLSLTSSQGKLGTAAYMAPEQEDARNADARSDVYALGLILWEILTGRAAWEVASSAEQLHRLKWQDRLVDLGAVPAKVPRALAEVAWKASRASPGERHGSVVALQTELRLAQAKVARELALLSSVGVGKAEQSTPRPVPAPSPRPDLLDSVELPGPKPVDEAARRERFEPPKPAPQPEPKPGPRPAPDPAPAPVPAPAPRPVPPPSPKREDYGRGLGRHPSRALSMLGLGVIGITIVAGAGLVMLSGGDKSRRAEIEWVSIPGGSFQMGSDDGDSNEQPVHTVRVSNFEMSRSEVTVAQYRACVEVGACSAPMTASYCNRLKWGRREDHPVNCVDWYQAVEFARWAEGRLPTEAEWEYAARGGQSHTYAGSDTIGDVAWYADNSGKMTHPVCRKKRNGYGLCDMSGNVWEWVEDWYHDSYLEAPTDGSAWVLPAGLGRVVRGGSWLYIGASDGRVTGRFESDPRGHILNSTQGFRVVRSSS